MTTSYSWLLLLKLQLTASLLSGTLSWISIIIMVLQKISLHPSCRAPYTNGDNLHNALNELRLEAVSSCVFGFSSCHRVGDYKAKEITVSESVCRFSGSLSGASDAPLRKSCSSLHDSILETFQSNSAPVVCRLALSFRAALSEQHPVILVHSPMPEHCLPRSRIIRNWKKL
jgi:hypothetical protein